MTQILNIVCVCLFIFLYLTQKIFKITKNLYTTRRFLLRQPTVIHLYQLGTYE